MHYVVRYHADLDATRTSPGALPETSIEFGDVVTPETYARYYEQLHSILKNVDTTTPSLEPIERQNSEEESYSTYSWHSSDEEYEDLLLYSSFETQAHSSPEI